MKNLFFYLILALSVLFTNCKGDDVKTEPELGWIELSVSGAIEGQYSGMADFYGEHAAGQVFYWSISGHDYKPQTFSLGLILTSLEELNQPGPGQYTIGHGANAPDVFLGTFTDVSGGVIGAVEYTTLETSGTLILEKSDSEEVIGSFEFNAKPVEGEEIIHVSGQFKAYPRQF